MGHLKGHFNKLAEHAPPNLKFSSYGIHWQTPTLMLSSFVSGAAFALAHHIFYASLDGKAPPHNYHIAGLSYDVSAQQINVAVGSAFAFLTKALLSNAIVIAYDQIIWKAVKKGVSNISDMDNLVPFSYLSLLNFRLWRHFPWSVTLGGLSIIISLAAVFPPATLTVALTVATNTTLLRVPRIDFTSLNFADLSLQTSESYPYPGWLYSGPQYSVQRVLSASAAQGEILPIPAPYLNSSWTLEFTGPALRCKSVTGSFYDDVIDNVLDAMKAVGCEDSYGYISWVPDGFDPLPFISGFQGTYSLRSDTLGPMANPSMGRVVDPMSIYVAAFPKMVNESPQANTIYNCTNATSALADATIVQCTLYNASYSTNFTYKNGDQNITIALTKSHADTFYMYGLGDSANPLGATYPNGTCCIPNVYNTSFLESFSYQAVMDSFGRILVGSITSELSEYIAGELVTSGTSVMSTILSQTKELSFLGDYFHDQLDTTFLGMHGPYWNGDSVSLPTNDTLPPLAETVESMFQNATVSLMSNALLQPNYSSPYAPSDVTVTLSPYRNIYIYSADVLWIAYGIAIAITLGSVLVGMITLVTVRTTYTTQFSTILRTTRTAVLSVFLDAVDILGYDPLPAHIAKAMIRFTTTIANEEVPAAQGMGIEMVPGTGKVDTTATAPNQTPDGGVAERPGEAEEEGEEGEAEDGEEEEGGEPLPPRPGDTLQQGRQGYSQIPTSEDDREDQV